MNISVHLVCKEEGRMDERMSGREGTQPTVAVLHILGVAGSAMGVLVNEPDMTQAKQHQASLGQAKSTI